MSAREMVITELPCITQDVGPLRGRGIYVFQTQDPLSRSVRPQEPPCVYMYLLQQLYWLPLDQQNMPVIGTMVCFRKFVGL